MSTHETIVVRLSTGADIPLHPMTSKRGNRYWAITQVKANGERYVSRFGRKVVADLIGGSLPQSATVMVPGAPKQEVTFTKGKTEKKGLPMREIEGEPISTPLGEKVLDLAIVDLEKDGEFSVSGSIHGVGGGSGPKAATEW